MGDGQSQPKPRGARACAGFFGAEETLENIGQVFRRDAGTGIAHDQFCIVTRTAQAEEDIPARRRILDGVGDQVEQHLLQAVTLAADLQLVNLRQFHLHFVGGQHAHLGKNFHKKRVQLDRGFRQREGTCLGFREQ